MNSEGINQIINKIRKEFVNSAYYFLVRCFKIGLLDETEMKNYCDIIDTGIDLFD